MKGNRRRQRSFGRRWISLLVIAAMLISMFSGLALADEIDQPDQDEYELQDSAEDLDSDEIDAEHAEAEDEEPDEDSAEESEEDSDSDDEEAETPDVPELPAGEEEPEAPSEDEEEQEEPEREPEREETDEPREEREEVTEEVALQVVNIEWPSQRTYELDEKPAYRDFADRLPETLNATLSDGSNYEVEAEWSCEDYSANYGRFIFSAAPAGSIPYEIARNVRFPKVALYIRYISAVKFSGEREYLVADKPARWAEDVADEMNWPTTIKARIKGEDDATENLPIVWTCEKYDRADDGEFTFTAGFAPEVTYIIGRKVNMPAITLRVVSDKKFTLALNRDDTLAITGLKDTRDDTVDVPAKIEGIAVTEIADKAFEDCDNLMMVKIADGIEKIGKKAFHGCDSLLVVELPDSLEDVASNAFDDEILEDLALVLNVRGETKLTRDDTFKHDGETVRLPEAIDSIVVEDDGELTIDTDFTVAADSFTGITVEDDATLKLTRGNTLINHGKIDVDGEFINNGRVYGCDSMSTLSGDIDDYITTHTGKTTCKICGEPIPEEEPEAPAEEMTAQMTSEEETGEALPAEGIPEEPADDPAEETPETETEDEAQIENEIRADAVDAELADAAEKPERQLKFVYNGTGKVTKTFDFTDQASVKLADFAFDTSNVAEGDANKIGIDKVEAKYDGADAGDHDVTVTFTISQMGTSYTYVPQPLTIQGTIEKRNIWYGSVQSEIPDQDYKDGEPIEPTVSLYTETYYNSETVRYDLTKGKDFNVISYENNTEKSGENPALIHIEGTGNFTGTASVAFKIIDKADVRELKYRLINTAHTRKEFDTTTDALLTPEDFEIVTQTIAEGDEVTITAVKSNYTSALAGLRPIQCELTIDTSKASHTYSYDENYTYENGRIWPFIFNSNNVDFTTISEINASEFDSYDTLSAKEEALIKKVVEATTVKIKSSGYTLVSGTDFEVTRNWSSSYSGPSQALPLRTGYYYFVIRGLGSFDGGAYPNFTVKVLDGTEGRTDISGWTIDDIDPMEYTGEERVLTQFSLSDGSGKALVEGTDYTLSYENNINAGDATLIVTGIGDYKGEIRKTFQITRCSISTFADVDPIPDQAYDGTAKEPELTVKDGEKALVKGTDYIVAYANNTEIGEATATLTGTGNYTGTKVVKFYIVEAGDTLTITLKDGKTFSRIYDGTANFGQYVEGVYQPFLTPDDFNITGAAEGDTVTLDADYLKVRKFGSKNVGSYTVALSFEDHLTSSAGNTYAISANSVKSVTGTITPKTITIKPAAGQSKNVGASDPAVFSGTISGILRGDEITGKLSRVSGEAAGTYRYTKGTLNAGDNYTIVVEANQTFTIKAADDTQTLVFTQKQRDSLDKAYKAGETTVDLSADRVAELFNVTDASGAAVSDVTATAVATYSSEGPGKDIPVKVAFTITSGPSGAKAYDLNTTADITDASAHSITEATLADIPQQTYEGQAVEPDVNLTYNGTKLVKGTDYELSYQNNTAPGTATVTITGKGSFTGTRSASFTIVAGEDPGEEMTWGEYTFVAYADGTAKITKWNGPASGTDFEGRLEVPAHLGDDDEYDVTGIAANSFSNEELEIVALPDGLRTIAADAFKGSDNFRRVEIPDSVISVGDIGDAELSLVVYGDTEITGQKTFRHGNATVTMPGDITDIEVENGGSANITSDFTTIHENDSIGMVYVGKGGKLTISNGAKLINKGMVFSEGEVANPGSIYSCYSRSICNVDGCVTTHTGTGTCSICGETIGGKTEKTVTIRYTGNPSKLNKVYDGDNKVNNIKASDFEVASGVESGDNVTITRVSGTYASADAGTDKNITFRFLITDDSTTYTYKAADLTEKGNITAKSITGSNMKLDAIKNQKYTGKDIEPDVTLKDNGIGYTLKKDTDYTLKYSNNRNEGEATVTITGKGNYTGERTTRFTITDSEAEHELTIRYKGSEPITKGYDGTTDCTVKRTDFEITGGVVSGDTVSIESVEAYYDSASVGTNKTVTVEFTLGQSKARNTYTVNDLTLTGEITAKNIRDNDVTVDTIPSQTYTGKAIEPTVTVRQNNRTLTLNTDYTVSYSNNTKAGTATVTINGTGNYTGSRTVNFTITDGTTARTVKITLISGHEPKKTYDGTANCGYYTGTAAAGDQAYHPLLSHSDFNVEGVASGDTVTVDDTYLRTLKFDGKDAGNRTVSLNLANHIQVTSSQNTYTVSTDSVTTIKGIINKKTLTVAPPAEQSINENKVSTYSIKASVTGLLQGDSISGKLAHDGDNSIGKHKINIGTLKTSDNYEIKLGDGYLIITRAINSSSVTVSLSKTTETYTGSAITPAVTVKDGSKTLTKDTDYTVGYANNINQGTAIVTVNGIGNYDGAVQKSFRIIKTSSATNNNNGNNTTNNNTTNNNSTTPTTSPDDTETPEDVDPTATPDPNAPLEDVSEEEEAEAAEAEEKEEEEGTDAEKQARQGQLLLNFDTVNNGDEEAGEKEDVAVGYILFGKDDKPRAFEYEIVKIEEEKEIDPETGKPVLPEGQTYGENDEILDADGNIVEPEPPKYQLIISPEPEKDANGVAIVLDETTGREAYETEQLRLTPTQIGTLKAENFVELLYRVGSAELRVQLDELTDEIDMTPFKPAEEQPEAEEDETWEEDPEAEAEAEAAPTEEPIQEVEGLEIGANMMQVDTYVFMLDQVRRENMTARERTALRSYDALLPAYRVDLSAVKGELKAITEESEIDGLEPPTELADNLDGTEAGVEYYPMLGVLRNVELRINDEMLLPERLKPLELPLSTDEADTETDEPTYTTVLPEGAQLMVIVDDDTLTDEEAVKLYPVTAVDVGTPLEAPGDEGDENWDDSDDDWDESEEDEDFSEDDSEGSIEDIPEDEEVPMGAIEPDEDSSLARTAEVKQTGAFKLAMASMVETSADTPAAGSTGEPDETEAPEPTESAVEEPDESADPEPTEEPAGTIVGKDPIEEEFEEIPPAEEAVDTVVAQYVTNDEKSEVTDYGRVELTRSALYAFVVENPNPPEEEEEEEEPIEAAEPEDSAEAPTPEPTAAPTPEPTPEPTVAVVEDPDSMYAYSRRSNAGNQYWLINTRAKTVEYYRADTNVYQIGDYTGSLMSGMLVTFRTPVVTTTIKLKFQQTYKFALMAEEDGELLMEQADINEVESIMQGQRK